MSWLKYIARGLIVLLILLTPMFALGAYDKTTLELLATHHNTVEGLPRGLVGAVIQVESNWNPKAIGAAGEIGLGQIKPSTVISLVGHDPYAKQRTLYMQGSKGEVVARIQAVLSRHGHKLVIDTVFGPLTHAAVVAYQTSNNLKRDGIVGVNTWSSLFPGEPFPGKTVAQALFDENENIYWTAKILAHIRDELGEDANVTTIVMAYNGGLGNGMLHHVRKVKAVLRKQP